MEKCINKYEEQGRAIINALDARGASKGWYKTLSDLYPDNAHFIFELLQNSEDVDATRVEFKLSDDSLIFLHNGTRAFSEDDINSITNIGDSNKTKNKIGKFGVGFKSVFAYTDTPQIHSKSVSFQIKNLIIPSIISKETIDHNYTTLFIFPFNRKNKTKEIAYREISNLFNELNDNVLLFLKGISEVVWSFRDGEKHSVIRKINHNVTEIINSSRGSSHWLIFKKDVEINNSEFETSIAYSFNKEEGKINRIKGDVSIFFPAKKEFSGLGFHINAPFSSTVARDSITDVDENRELLFGIAELCAESIHSIKKLGLLKMSFFEVLPNVDDELSNFYEPIYNRFLQEFDNSENELIPLENGKLSNLKNCIFSSKLLKDTFADDDLNVIFDSDSIIGFAKNALKNSRGDKFISRLKMNFIDDSHVFDTLKEFSDEVSQFYFENWCDEEHEINACKNKRNWLQTKTNEQLQAIYSFVCEANVYSKIYEDFSSIIKLSNGEYNFNHEDVYFSESDNMHSDFLFVEPATYLSGKIQKQQKQSKEFLEDMGVRELDESVHLELLFNDYEIESENVHLQHINRLVNFYVNNGNSINSKFKDYEFLYTVDNNLSKTVDTFIDDPFEHTGIKYVSDLLSLNTLSGIYKKVEKLPVFLLMIKDLGAITRLRIKIASIYNNPEYSRMYRDAQGLKVTEAGTKIDWNIDELEDILRIENNRIEVSKLVWSVLNKAEEYHFLAKFKMNASSDRTEISKSQLIHTLSEYDWIPDVNGCFYNPRDIARDMLRDDFIYDNQNGWLDEIDFGKNILHNQQKNDEADQLLQGYGLNISVIEEIQRSGITTDELLNYLNQHKFVKTQRLQDAMQTNQGTGESPEIRQGSNDNEMIINDDAHQVNIANENEGVDVGTKAYTTAVIRQNSEEMSKIKDFLYKQYEGHCQICGDTFNGAKDENYYEIFSLNRGANRDVNRKGNTLCLCPRHHAIFKEKLHKMSFVANLPRDHLDLPKIRDRYAEVSYVGKDNVINENDGFYALPEEDNFEADVFLLPITLFGKDFYIKFTQDHMQNFIAVWNNN
jgi:hypothetical protein